MTIESFLIDFGPYLLISILLVTWKLWAPIVFAHTFNKKLAEYKTDLETEKEKALAEYGKRITGFNKFFNMKYDIYPVLFKEIVKLHGELASWAPMQSVPDFDVLTIEEFREYIETFGFSKPDVRDLLDKKERGELSSGDIFVLLPEHFRRCVGETSNYFLLHRIFLSREMEALVSESIKISIEIQKGYQNVFSARGNRDKWDEIDLRIEQNAKLVEEILSLMRTELEHSVSN